MTGMAVQQTIMLVEDDLQTRQRLERVIAAAPQLRVSAAVGNLHDARASLSQARPDVLLVDLGLPDGSGADLIREASAVRGTHIMVITVFGDEAHVVEAIEAGATGYLLKDASTSQINRAIADLLAGGSPISPAVARHLLKRFQPHEAAASETATANLSEREIEVLRLIARGDSYGEIARSLDISVNTVSTYTKQIYRKLAVNSRGKAVYEAVQQGLLEKSVLQKAS
jgi:DNA-binding NarL/FixJ family response regulator